MIRSELDDVGVRHYTNERLGIKDYTCSPKCEYFEQEDIKRIQLNWKGCWDNGKLGWWVGNMGISTVVANKYSIGGEALVVWDKDGYVSGIHRSRFDIV